MTSAPSGSRDPQPNLPTAPPPRHQRGTSRENPGLLSELAEVTGELLWREEGRCGRVGALWAFLRLGFTAKQTLMGIALVGQTTGEEGEEVTVNTEMKRAALIILAPS